MGAIEFTLFIIITRWKEEIVSDHNTVIADLKVPIAPAVSKHNVFYIAIHSINIASFMTDIITSDLVT